MSDRNFRLRFFLIVFAGIAALGSVLYWRSQLLLSQEFVPSPRAARDKPKLPASIIDSNQSQPLNEE